MKKDRKKEMLYLCSCHTVSILKPDGIAIKETFKFGSDRENIEPFVKTS